MQGKNVLYYNLKVDRRSVPQMRALVTQIDAIIDELFSNALKSVSTGNYAEYELDTGQTKTRIRYNSVQSVTDQITSFENLRTLYLNQIENKTMGRQAQLVDQSNFRRS